MQAPKQPRPSRSQRRRRAPIGASPGSLHIDPEAPRPRLRAIAWDATTLRDRVDVPLRDLADLRAKSRVLWLDVQGLGDAGILSELGTAFAMHRLALEDVVSTHQRAKVEDYPEHQFVVLRMVSPTGPCETEQLSLCLGDGFLLTFQELPGDSFDAVRHRLQDAGGRLRNRGPDYLAYALLDAVVDAYFPRLEAIGDRLEAAETGILADAAPRAVHDLHGIRRDLLVLRRALWPLREATGALARGESPRFLPETRVYLRDVHDHVVQLLDLVENYRDLCASLLDLHLAATSNRLNEVMKVLTVIATIFIPLTFVVGIYGMNFDMPELHWRYSYPVVMASMLAIATAMLVWFRRRRWI